MKWSDEKLIFVYFANPFNPPSYEIKKEATKLLVPIKYTYLYNKSLFAVRKEDLESGGDGGNLRRSSVIKGNSLATVVNTHAFLNNKRLEE